MNRKMRGSQSVQQPMIYLRSWADDVRDRSDDLGERLHQARGWVAYHRPSFEGVGNRVFEARVAWAGWPRANRYGFASGGVVGITASSLLGLVLLASPQALPSVVAPPSGLLEVGAGPDPSPDSPIVTQSLPTGTVASSGSTPGGFNLRFEGAPVMGFPSAVPSAGIFGPLPAVTASQSAPQVRPAPPPHAGGRPQPPPHARTPVAPPPHAQAPARPPQAHAPPPAQAPARPPRAEAPSRPPQAQAPRPRPPRAEAPSRPPQAQTPRPRPPRAEAPSRPPQAQAPRPRPPQAQAPSPPPQAQGQPARPPQAQGPKK